MLNFLLSYSNDIGCLDTIQIEKSGLIRLEGWSEQASTLSANISCRINGLIVPIFEIFRTYRPDVAQSLQLGNFFTGVVIVFLVPKVDSKIPSLVEIFLCGEQVFKKELLIEKNTPSYESLFNQKQVLGREDIYGYGPPSSIVSEDVARLAMTLPGPVLDFGCGSGVLVKTLRESGIEAYGIELDRDAISESLLPEIRDYVILYDGKFPLPFRDKAFQSVIATEVLEHIHEYLEALNEISRVTEEMLVVTVPDMSSIPVCHHNNVVPWHLLESTHVNFFTQASLSGLLRNYFQEVEMARIGPVTTNNSIWYVSLAATCRKMIVM